MKFGLASLSMAFLVFLELFLKLRQRLCHAKLGTRKLSCHCQKFFEARVLGNDGIIDKNFPDCLLQARVLQNSCRDGPCCNCSAQLLLFTKKAAA